MDNTPDACKLHKVKKIEPEDKQESSYFTPATNQPSTIVTATATTFTTTTTTTTTTTEPFSTATAASG